MPLAPPIAMSQGATANDLMLTVGGVDMILTPGTAPTAGVPVETLEITEAGPGAVSSLRFSVEDPGQTVALPQDGALVILWDLVNDVPLFRGTLDHYQVIPLGIGRRINIECDGVEKQLDSIIPSDTGANGARLCDEIARLASRYLRVYPYQVDPASVSGTRVTPVGQLGILTSSDPTLTYAVTLEGVTFREAVRKMAAASQLSNGRVLPSPNLTVDFYNGLRAWPSTGSLFPDDYGVITVDNDDGSPRYSGDLNFQVHPSDVVREVYVKGASAGVSGWYSDGSGITGEQAYISDADLDTADKVRDAATAYLAGQAATVRGTYVLEAMNPTETWHAGGITRFIDSRFSWSNTEYVNQTIRKRFPSGNVNLQNWEIHFGGNRPSAMRAIRNLNRNVLS